MFRDLRQGRKLRRSGSGCVVFLNLGDVMAHFSNLDIPRTSDEFAGALTAPSGLYRRFVKRGFDIIIVLLAALVVPAAAASAC